MSVESVAKILYNSAGYEIAVSGGMPVPVSASGLLMAGQTLAGSASILRTAADGTLFVSGNFGGSSAVATLTGANSALVVNQGTPASFGNSWNVQLTNGVSAIGNTNTAPVYVLPQNYSSASVTTVATNTGSVTLVSSSVARRGLIITNDSTFTLYVRFGAAPATTTNYTIRLLTNGVYEVQYPYTGEIRGILTGIGANGNAQITELFV